MGKQRFTYRISDVLQYFGGGIEFRIEYRDSVFIDRHFSNFPYLLHSESLSIPYPTSVLYVPIEIKTLNYGEL